MSLEYDEYLGEHVYAVNQAYRWLHGNLPQFFEDISIPDFEEQIAKHDQSKSSNTEYPFYDAHFCGEIKETEPEYMAARTRHMHRNGHHWQHWVLIHNHGHIDAIDMPDEYIIEMLCDWWSFSWMDGNLNNIFDWYERNAQRIILSRHTRETLENILCEMKHILDGKPDNHTHTLQ